MSDQTSRPLTVTVRRPLVRTNAVANIHEETSPNPFIADSLPGPDVPPLANKRPFTSGGQGSDPAGIAPKRRFVVPTAMAARMASARSTSPGFSSFSAAYKLYGVASGSNVGAADVHGSSAFPSLDFTLGGGDTDLEDSSSDIMPSSPTRGPTGSHQAPMASLGSCLTRRSTDASLIESVEAGRMAIVPEEDEESDQDQASQQAERQPLAVGDEGSEGQGSTHQVTTPYTFNRGYATPDITTPAIARVRDLGGSSVGFTFYDGVNLGDSLTPHARTNLFTFTREPLTSYVYEMAKFKKILPGVSAQRSPLITLLHILSWVTGGEGVSIEGFGRSLAECGLCDRFLFVDYQEVHRCMETRGLTRGLTDRGQIAPMAVVSWLIDRKGSLCKRDMDTLFSLCNGCHYIVLNAAGETHALTCTARRAASATD